MKTHLMRLERAFCKIFADILELDEVGATEDFFELGGTSLLVTRIMIEAEKAGYAVNFADVFARPTPRLLAELFIAKNVIIANANSLDNDVKNYDYTKINSLLAANTLECFKTGERQALGDVLLTGATGYLGIHILHELVENYDCKIYCMLRGRKNYSAEDRFRHQLFYYFENDYNELFGKRLFVIDGDVTHEIKNLKINTVINCAAVVKHFSAGTEIEDTNVGGVKNLINYCINNNLRLIQVSTMSTVSTFMDDGSVLPAGRMIGEQDLYFGQSLTNQYVHSKFLAERLILEAIAEKKLNAKIMRVGSLSARYSDGEFQINSNTNSSMGRLKIYAMLGACPYEQLDVPMEFSPIDATAKAIIKLCETPRECVLFHPYSHNNTLSADVFKAMTRCGLTIKPVECEEFNEAIRIAENDPVKARLLTSMLAYQSGGKNSVHIPRHNSYTMQVLYRMAYQWPVTTPEYLEKFINALKGLGFFDVNF
ncbi:MAG: SDR family oxidoreductase [Synergistaceae bacterium]|nr:SDR family oxidoreductase [Synergistaceae bacterium]